MDRRRNRHRRHFDEQRERLVGGPGERDGRGSGRLRDRLGDLRLDRVALGALRLLGRKGIGTASFHSKSWDMFTTEGAARLTALE